MYDGPTTPIYSPAHGVAWRDDQPTGVTAFGYIFGLVDASTPAGGTRMITGTTSPTTLLRAAM
ncbi:MAG: hypothetical protein WKH64_15010 [Chloroflexia bacterium]